MADMIADRISQDVQRHKERVREALKSRLPEVVAREDIVTAPTGRRLRVPVRFLDDVRFRPAPPAGDDATPAAGGEGLPGLDHEEPAVEVELTLEEIADLLFETLRLPNLQPKTAEDETPQEAVEGVARQGPAPRLDRRRTLLERLKTGGPLREDHLRFRDARPRPRPVARAVVVFVRDASGSMDDDKRFRVRAAAFWTLSWLRRQYPHVESAFVVHDTAAEEVDEHAFFHVGVMGGTLISTGLELAAEILEARYPRQEWNRYVLFFSDGENWPGDREDLIAAVRRLHEACELVAYGEVEAGRGPHRALDILQPLAAQLPRYRAGTIRHPAEVAGWLGAVFGGGGHVA
ncbi:MAG: DUF444 family protein [Firmicutes bacterium]|nr:DUF444 family protein [Bacillota bacterium]